MDIDGQALAEAAVAVFSQLTDHLAPVLGILAGVVLVSIVVSILRS